MRLIINSLCFNDSFQHLYLNLYTLRIITQILRKFDILTRRNMNGQSRKDIYPGLSVAIILKKDQRSGNLTEGIVKDILTSSPHHSRGIKVRLEDGQVGRVAEILEEE